VLAVVLAVSAWVLLSPDARLIVVGLYRGEKFYQGKPTGYWSKRLQDHPNTLHSSAGAGSEFAARPATLLDSVKALTGIGKPAFTPADPWLTEGDPEALPVLQDLLHDPNPDVRGYAAEALGEYGPTARASVPALLGILNDKTNTGTGFTVGRRATLALIQIDPDAALAAGVVEAAPWVKALHGQ
jgi:hypothetical protein